MLLGGLWHGASWNFVFWGLLHGLYLTVNHAWSKYLPNTIIANLYPPLHRFLAHALTMLFVMIAWVFFRAESFDGAEAILKGMFGMSEYHNVKIWVEVLQDSGLFWIEVFALTLIVVWCPNSVEIVKNYRPVIGINKMIRRATGFSKFWRKVIIWRPSHGWSSALFVVGVISLIQIYRLNELTEFIYFNF